jgi:DNA polymerase III subunit beta
MKIECVKEKLLNAVQTAERITGKNLTLPILSTLYIETKQSKVVIKATNLDLGIEVEIPAKITAQGSVSVPGSILLGLLINSDADKVDLELVDNTLHISSGRASATVKTFAGEEFPIIPRTSTAKTLEIDTEHFVDGLRSVWFSAATSSIKPELASVFVYTEGEYMLFVATDSFRLAEKKVPAKKAKDFPGILIPFKNIGEIIRVLENVGGVVNVSIDGNQISFEKDSLYLLSRVIDASFPDYKQILPKESTTECVLLKQDLITALKIANVFSDSFNQVMMKIVPGQKLFELTTKNSQVGENITTIEAALTGEDVSISFNYKYIFDSFSSIKSDSVILSFQGMGKPVSIKGVSDKTFQYIVMPMNK